jgi:hypothetical protein
MRHRAAALIAIVGLLATASAQDKDAAVLESVLERLSEYLRVYEKQLTAITADERYEQRATMPGYTYVSPALRALRMRQRQLDSEMAFVRLPGDAEWAGYRDVRKVDGKRVEGTGVRLADVLAGGANAFVKAAAMTAASSKYNLGAQRTINMPTVPLEVLHPRHRSRFSYRLAGTERVRGVKTVRVEFVEMLSPTVIRGPDGGNLPSAGTAWIDPGTGQLWRAMVVWNRGTLAPEPEPDDSRLLVEFAVDRRLKTMVPVEMREVFYVPDGRGSAVATYKNFKRFETGARIIP